MVGSAELKRIAEAINGKIVDEGGGYRSVYGFYRSGYVAYVELPRGHPDIGKDETRLKPRVNGGLTFGYKRIFGWDYSHHWDDHRSCYSIDEHIRNALSYFRRREKKC